MTHSGPTTLVPRVDCSTLVGRCSAGQSQTSQPGLTCIPPLPTVVADPDCPAPQTDPVNRWFTGRGIIDRFTTWQPIIPPEEPTAGRTILK